MAVHEMRLNKKPFEMIKSGKKTVELRLYDEKRRKLAVGDKIIFRNTESNETLSVTISGLHIYDSFRELYKHFDKSSIGYEENEIPDPNDMNEYYTPAEQEKFGVIGIEIYSKI